PRLQRRPSVDGGTRAAHRGRTDERRVQRRVLARAARHRGDPRAHRPHHDRREGLRPAAHGGGAERTRPPRLNAVTDVRHRIEPAKLLPGVAAADLERRVPAPEAARDEHTIRGKALIFWDRSGRRPGKKLDAIDTDQITPAKDCVSESLDTLDERWQAGSFRFLMPDFRKRVHAGETFVIAGDRFAIGSSREMSPAGLKAVAEEAGLTMVIVCGHNMGDIFRRNSFNLGLHVVQCPPAVADAQEGDAFSFEPATRLLTNESQNKRYDALPLTPKEDEIRRSGGIFTIGRREFVESVRRPPVIEWPDDETARRMTTTERIVWAHRVDKDAEVRPGAPLRGYADLLPASAGPAPFAIHTFNQITGGDTISPRQIAVANDHFVF